MIQVQILVLLLALSCLFTNNIVHITSYQTANALPCFVWGGAIFYYYVGVAGKARKVKKVYVGVGGKARLVWAAYVKVTRITLTLNNKYADRPTITAVFIPSGATNQKVTWDITTSGNAMFNGISIVSSTDHTCTVMHKNEIMNFFTTITAKSMDGVTVKYSLSWTYNNFGSFWELTKK